MRIAVASAVAARQGFAGAADATAAGAAPVPVAGDAATAGSAVLVNATNSVAAKATRVDFLTTDPPFRNVAYCLPARPWVQKAIAAAAICSTGSSRSMR